MRCKSTGPLDAKLMLLGEAPGAEEEFKGVPFVGSSGQELDVLLKESKIDRSTCRLTNVFMTRPPDNKLHDNWCVSKREAVERYKLIRQKLIDSWPDFDWPVHYSWANVNKPGCYISPEHLVELPRLKAEIESVRPNLIVCLGGTALWALTNATGIKKLRGSVTEALLVPGQKILPTLHPAYVQRVWDDRLILLTDLMKAKSEAEFPEIRRPKRLILARPTISDLDKFYQDHIKACKILSFDIETARKRMTCISFATSPNHAIVVPFIDKSKKDYLYWATQDEEILALKFVKQMLSLPMPKLAQNGLYDIQYLWRIYGIPVRNYLHDTMLLYHALYIELPKDLGFLGSVETNEIAWKLMRNRNKDSVEKKDD